VLSRQKGELKRGVLFSKLKSKSWPDSKHIIASIPKYFKRTKLTIELRFQNQDSMYNPKKRTFPFSTDEAELEALRRKLRKVELQVCPVREGVGSSFQASPIGKHRSHRQLSVSTQNFYGKQTG
jgi:hypothetical protein